MSSVAGASRTASTSRRCACRWASLLVVYEARPNVTVDVAGLCLKSGNACILRGSTSARHTNAVLLRCVREGLTAAGLPEDAVIPLEATREELAAIISDPSACDVVIPRGGEGLKKFLLEHARVPCWSPRAATATSTCTPTPIRPRRCRSSINAKTQRPGVCNAAETLLVHRDALPLLGPIGAELAALGVELRADEEAAAALGAPSVPADEEDWATEYLDLVLAVRTVGSVEEAIDHIERYSTGHSEAIVTESLGGGGRLRPRHLERLRVRQCLDALHRRRRVRLRRRDRQLDSAPARPWPDRPRRHHDDEVRRARRRPDPRLSRGALAPQARWRRRTTQPLWPPRPIEFERAYSISTSRAPSGT